tara:strand:+ start:721 stop:831 length:111 start_codon:yes stop_codon:yes gene_type:complete
MSGDGQWFYIRKWAYLRRLREEKKDKPPVEEEGKDA